jgi:hypothetical protein
MEADSKERRSRILGVNGLGTGRTRTRAPRLRHLFSPRASSISKKVRVKMQSYDISTTLRDMSRIVARRILPKPLDLGHYIHPSRPTRNIAVTVHPRTPTLANLNPYRTSRACTTWITSRCTIHTNTNLVKSQGCGGFMAWLKMGSPNNKLVSGRHGNMLMRGNGSATLKKRVPRAEPLPWK